MDRSVTATDLGGALHDLSLWGLFLQADWVVKTVMIMLLLASVWVWAIVFEKYTSLRRANRAADAFEDSFWSGGSLDDLFRKEGEQPTEITVTRYVLTEEGKKYLHTRGTPDTQADFCAAHLTLDKVVGWEARKETGDADKAKNAAAAAVSVTYTYKVEAAPWTGDADVQKAFPMVDRVVRGAGTMQLKQNFRHTDSGWVPEGV